MLNLNPELVNQDKIRKLRRRRLLKIAFTPCLLLLLCSAFVFRIGVFNVVYSISYGNQNFELADSLAEGQGIGNFITPYIRFYDGGVAKLRMRNYKEAEEDFRASLKEDPPAEVLCSIYTNLSLSIELQADSEFNKEHYDEALVLYSKAQSTLFSNGCASKDEGKEKDAMAQKAKSRIDSKLSKTMNKINSVSDGDGDGDGAKPTDKIITKEQEDVLEQRRGGQKDVNWRVNNAAGSTAGTTCDTMNRVCW